MKKSFCIFELDSKTIAGDPSESGYCGPIEYQDIYNATILFGDYTNFDSIEAAEEKVSELIAIRGGGEYTIIIKYK